MLRFATTLRTFLLAVACALFASLAVAQQAPLVGVDPIRASLDQIEASAKSTGLRTRALTDLAQRLPPLRDQLRDKLSDLEPRLADIDARLKGLGPAPTRDAAPEDAGIAAERARLTQQRAEIDAAIKQVQLLQMRAEQEALAQQQKLELFGHDGTVPYEEPPDLPELDQAGLAALDRAWARAAEEQLRLPDEVAA